MIFGRWVARQGHPRVSWELKGRWIALSAACFAPPWLVLPLPDAAAAPHLAADPPSPPPPPKPRGRERRAAPYPQNPRKVPTRSRLPPIYETPRSGRNFFGRWVFKIGRWVFTILGVGSRIRPWALGGTDQVLGVGWHGSPFGRWVFKMPLAKALGDSRPGGDSEVRGPHHAPPHLGTGRVP